MNQTMYNAICGGTGKMIKSIIGICFDCPKANELADFYEKISGWKREISSDE